MAPISTLRLEELVREAEVLSSIRADVPNAWRILEHEIGRVRAAIVQSMEASPSDATNNPEPSSSEPPPHITNPIPILSDRLSQHTTHSTQPPSSAPPMTSSTTDASNSTTTTSSALSPAISSLHIPPPPSSTTATTTPASSTAPPTTAAAAAAIAAFADASHPPPTATRHPIRKRVKLRVPAEQFPDYNFVGRLLGPRGATLKRLERDTACRIMIRGKGSIRKDKEAEVRGKPGWEHVFHEPLHVVIEVADAADEATASRTLAEAKELVEMLLVPVPEERDSLKRAQLRDLAILNGTHRSVSDLIAPAPQLHHQVPLNPSCSPPPPPSLVPSPPPLRRTHSALAKQSPSLYHHSTDPYTVVFDQAAPFSRLASPPPPPASSMPQARTPQPAPQAQTPLVSSAPFTGGNSFNGNPSMSADSFLSDLSKLRIPTLNFDSLNDSTNLSSPLPLPLPSPTIVDPDIYPYPPTPGLVSVEQGSLGAFGSPMWSTHGGTGTGSTNGIGGGNSVSGSMGGGPLPPRSPPPGLPPRSPPPPSAGEHGAGGSNSFLLARQMGEHHGGGSGRFTGREVAQRDTAFDHGFGPHVSSPQFRDEDLTSLAHLTQGHRGGSGGGPLASPIGSPPPPSPPASLQQQKIQQQQQQQQQTQQAFASSDSILLSNLFQQQQASSEEQNEHVSLRFHQSHLQGNSQPLVSAPPPSTTGPQ